MIEYRKAEARDTEAIALLHVQSWRANNRGSFTDAFLDEELPEERLRAWRERLADPPRDQFVQLAFDGGSLAGFVCAYGEHDPRWGSFIDNLHVASASKRGGIGSALMQQAGAWLERYHAGFGVYLWVLETNSPARRFYERLGARNEGVATMETHGKAMVRSCRYTWPKAQLLSAS